MNNSNTTLGIVLLVIIVSAVYWLFFTGTDKAPTKEASEDYVNASEQIMHRVPTMPQNASDQITQRFRPMPQNAAQRVSNAGQRLSFVNGDFKLN